MVVKEWLWNFLTTEGRELIGPDGRPLFAYQMTKTEYERLEQLLSSCMESRGRRIGFALHTGRAFVLYGAEWWRRNYNGGPWKWELITKSIGWQNVDQKYLIPMVVEGMQYWRRDILRYRTGNAYLTSIVLEGGIPLPLLQQQGASFTRYLKAVLGEHAKWSSAGMSAYSHAVNCQRLLTAKSLRKEQIFQLSASIVDVIYSLSEDLESKTDPFSELTTKHPDWQRQLPMAIEDEEAKNLVDALLKEAQKKRNSKYERFVVNRYLSEVDDQWRQTATLEIPESIPTEVLSEQLNRPSSKLPSRLELIARTESFTLKVASLIRVQRDQDEYNVSFYRRDRLSIELPFMEAITCTIQSAGNPIGDYSVEGSEAVDMDLPMLFVPDDAHGFRLLGGGSISSRIEEGRLILPPGAEVQQGNADPVENRLNHINFFSERSIYDVSGELTIRLEDDFVCRIRLGANRDSSTHYILNGKRLYALEHKSLPVFTGLPALIPPQGGMKPNKVIWRSEYRGSEWINAETQPPLGCVRLRALYDDECLFASKIVVLPKDFQYSIHSSDGLNIGTLLLHGLEGADVTHTDNQTMNVVVEREGDIALVACQGGDVAGGRFPLNLGWSNGRHCALNMPFPGEGARFTNIDKGVICNRRVSIVDLLAVSAQAVSPKAYTKYKLVAELRAMDIDKEISRSSMYFEKAMPLISEGFHELPLVDLYSPIKELFSYSADLDATVRLEIISNGKQECFIDVVQFGSELVFDPTTLVVTHHSDNSEQKESFKLLPFNHDEPIEELIPRFGASESGSNSEWLLSGGVLAGTGLVIAEGQLGRLVRPCVMFNDSPDLALPYYPENSESEDVNDSPLDSEESMAISDVWQISDYTSRKEAFSGVFNSLLDNPDHDDWSVLIEYIDRFKEAHPDCLDAHEILIDHPETLLGLIFRSQPEVVDIVLEWEEYIPLRLWMIPLVFWQNALASYLSYLYQFSDLIVKLEKEKLIKILKQIRSREPNTILIINELLSSLDESSDRTELDQEYDSAKNINSYISNLQTHVATTMFGRPDDERWPTGFDRDHWNSLDNNPLWLDPGAGYRRAFLDAPVYTAFAVAKGRYLERNHRAYIAAIRNFDSQSFDDLFLKTLVVFFKLIK